MRLLASWRDRRPGAGSARLRRGAGLSHDVLALHDAHGERVLVEGLLEQAFDLGADGS